MVNVGLSGHTGTETHLRDHALEFLRGGHEVMIYAPVLGPIASEISRAGGEVCSRLVDFAQDPDVIHASHHLQLVQAMLRFRDAPAVYMCHDATSWNARPIRFPRVYKHIAVDWNCQERVVGEVGGHSISVPVVPNTVDTTRFLPRSSPPAKPRRALVYGGGALRSSYIPAVKSACAKLNILVDVVSESFGSHSESPEEILPKYDIVIAKARCALEALAVGCHVILCSERGLGPTITTQNFPELYRWNLGARLMTQSPTAGTITNRILAYNALVCDDLRTLVRRDCSVSSSSNQLIAIYQDTICRSQSDPRPTLDSEFVALSNYFSSLERDLQRLDKKIFLANYRGLRRHIMNHIKERPGLRRWLKRIVYWMIH